MVKNIFILLLSGTLLVLQPVFGQVALHANHGHSHNDYKQAVPLKTAYNAGMGSIEADIFLRSGQLFVAHEASEIETSRTLKQLYLNPLAEIYKANNNRPYPRQDWKLQLVIDLKQDYREVLPVLIRELNAFEDTFDASRNPRAIRIVISGNMPPPAEFGQFPKSLSFDGRPQLTYTPGQLERIAMISDDLKAYTIWNGKGNPTGEDEAKLRAVISKAHGQNKPFRFWATQDSPNTWIVLERLGADWINTDQPAALQQFYANAAKQTYTRATAQPVYTPAGDAGYITKAPKNVILLIGDGMGLAQIHAAAMANHGTLNILQIPHIGFAQTSAADAGNTDSAAGATALATGTKTNNRFIGVDPAKKPMTNLVDTLAGWGFKSGIISTGDITDATPACFYAHQPERSMSQAIAADLANSKAQILIGSNQKSFSTGSNAALPARLHEKGFDTVDAIDKMSTKPERRQLVLLPDSATRPVLKGRTDLLRQALQKTVASLSQNKAGFFIMAEGAQIDHGGHANDLPFLVTELHDFDLAVEAALRFADTNKETLVIVTADHETGGLSLLDTDPAKGMIRGAFSTNDHTNIMVPVFAYGPGAAAFTGTYPNNEIFHKILKSLSLKPKSK
ncbi:alkaline phosphatase [Pedobacter sp. SYP-B3415]|uniref:alkaline phosphatase n=1 Tax=Pedobacter sp. SYP-B3415 TaxID=2496641 RepID=UPI001F0D5F91|nr:alkaline phosphatase [Pedobacter sp. SYP-B3415]